MKTKLSRRIVMILTAAACMATGQLAMMDAAFAKSAHCSAVPVPGQPGHFVVICSRVRP